MKKKSKEIICRNKDKSDVEKNAEDNFKSFKNGMKTKRKVTYDNKTAPESNK